jgi:hypothetical protein
VTTGARRFVVTVAVIVGWRRGRAGANRRAQSRENAESGRRMNHATTTLTRTASGLRVATTIGASLAWGGTGCRSRTSWRERRDLYPEGVASGDPDPHSVIL